MSSPQLSPLRGIYLLHGGLSRNELDAARSHRRFLEHVRGLLRDAAPTPAIAAGIELAVASKNTETGAFTVIDTTAVVADAETHDSLIEIAPNTNKYLVVKSSVAPLEEALLASFFAQRRQGVTAMLEALDPAADSASADVEPAAATANTGNDSIESVVEAITLMFEQTMLKRRPSHRRSEDSWDNGGRDAFAVSVRRYVVAEVRILFVLPAFPFKSSNTETKVLGALPDMGELVALRRLDDFLKNVEAIHKKGAHLIIFSDGRVYCDLFRIPDDTTSAFKSAVRKLMDSPRITWSDLDMFYPGLTDDEKRVALEAIFGTTPEAVAARIKNDADFLEVYCGFKKFMTEELSVRATGTVKQVRNILSDVARRLMMRNYAYGAFVKLLFPAHVRLSIHPSSNSEKFSINLVGESDWGTPWHNCVLRNPEGRWCLVRKGVAETAGFELCTSPEGLQYYQAAEDQDIDCASPWVGSPALRTQNPSSEDSAEDETGAKKKSPSKEAHN